MPTWLIIVVTAATLYLLPLVVRVLTSREKKIACENEHLVPVADPVRFPDLSLTIVKLMGRGEYAVELPGDAAPGHLRAASLGVLLVMVTASQIGPKASRR
jgi:predicted ATPase with chaperone activity